MKRNRTTHARTANAEQRPNTQHPADQPTSADREARAGAPPGRRKRKRRNRGRIAGTSLAALVAAGMLTGTVTPSSASTLAPPAAAATTAATADGLRFDPAAAFASGIIAKIGGDGFDSVMGHLGLKETTSMKLDKVLGELQEIKSQLVGAERRLSEQANRHHFSDQWSSFSHERTRITDAFGALLDLGNQIKVVNQKALALDAAKGTPAEAAAAADLATAKQNLETVKGVFNDYGRSLRTERGVVRDHLMPGRAENIIQAYRDVVRADRFMTKQHSDQLEDMYTGLENYEALAVYVEAEWNLLAYSKDYATDQIHRLANGLDEDTKAQRRGLPASIPPGVVVDTGVMHETTLNKPMYKADPGRFVWFPGAKDDGAPGEINRLNAQRATGQPRWQMPSLEDVQQLFSGADAFLAAHPDKSRADYLGSLNLGTFTTDDWIWTANTEDKGVDYDHLGHAKTWYWQQHDAVHVGAAPGYHPQPALVNPPRYHWSEADMAHWVDGQYRITQMRVLPKAITNTTYI